MSIKPPRRRPAVWSPFASLFSDPRSRDVRSTVKLYRRIQKAHYASTWHKTETIQALIQLICGRIDPPPYFISDVIKIIGKLLTLETHIFQFPDDLDIETLSLKEQVNLRTFLRRKERFLARDETNIDMLATVIINSLKGITESLPRTEATSTTFTVPLNAFIKDLPAVMNRIISNVVDEKVHDNNLCLELYDRITTNIQVVSGIVPGTDSSKQLIFPDQANLPPATLIPTYFARTPYNDFLTAPAPFAITHRFSHQHIVATPGAGKTNLIGVLLALDFDQVARGAASVIVLDSQGDLINSIVRMKDFAPGRRLHDRLVYIDPTDIQYPLQLNIFARSGNRTLTLLQKRTEHSDLVQLLLFLFGALKQEATGRQETMIKAVASLIQEIPDATLMTLNAIFEPSSKKTIALTEFKQYFDRLDPAIRNFFEIDFNGGEFSQTRAQLRARIQSLITDPIFLAMFSATSQRLDFASEMNAGKVIVINAYEDLLKSSTEIFGRFFVALAAQAAQARQNIPEQSRLPTYCYIDECYKFIKADTNIETILDTGRKYRLGMILAHQRLKQLSDALKSAASGAAIKMVRAPVHEDANTLASQLNTKPDYFDALPEHAFATRITSMRQPTALTVPLSPLATAEHMSETEFEEVRNVMRRKYARTSMPSDPAPPSPPHDQHQTTQSTSPDVQRSVTSSQWSSDEREP